MEKDFRIAQAVAELTEAMEFVMDMWRLDPEEAIEAVNTRYPEFAERFDAMENVDEEDFLIQFAYWALNKRFREKCPDIWEEVKYAYLSSPAEERLRDKAKLMEQIEQIVKESDLEEE